MYLRLIFIFVSVVVLSSAIFVHPRKVVLDRYLSMACRLSLGMQFGLFLCTANSCWDFLLFAISKVKDLPYLAIAVSVGFIPHPIPLL